MATIKQILKQKGKDIWQTTPDTHVFDALQLMAERDIGALLVMDGKKLIGIFSERDYARKVILKGKSSKDIFVGEVMSSPVVFITPQQTDEQGLALMTATHVRHLPVMENDHIRGVVSIGDLVKSIMGQQKQTIDKLEKYILANTSIT